MRVVLFGTAGAFSAAHLDALVGHHQVVGAFIARESRGVRRAGGTVLRRLGLRDDPFTRAARTHGVPQMFTGADGDRVADAVQHLRPDVVCVAGYPWKLPASVWASAPLGAVNVHPSLLPRHRGVLPLFWIYYHDDRRTGVTVHRMTERLDAGPIIVQEEFPLERGFPVEELATVKAEVGSRLLLHALTRVEAGDPGAEQRAEEATRAPRVAPGSAMLDRDWDVERVWHVLAGLCPRFIEPLRDASGARAEYSQVCGYARGDHDVPPGTVHRTDAGWTLWCRGGQVMLAAGSRRSWS